MRLGYAASLRAAQLRSDGGAGEKTVTTSCGHGAKAARTLQVANSSSLVQVRGGDNRFGAALIGDAGARARARKFVVAISEGWEMPEVANKRQIVRN